MVKRSDRRSENKRPEKIASGIINFDKLCGGGFNRDSVNLVVGGAGSGKTIFAIQFLIGGIKAGEPGLYITFEEKKEELYRNMKEFGWDLEKLEKEKLFVFVEYTPEKVRTMLEEGGGIIENIVQKNKIKRIVIDSITSFELLFDSEIAKREAALTLFDMTREWGCISMLTLERELTETDLHSVSSTPLEFEVDGIILLYFLRENGTRQRSLEILKMRGTTHSRKVHTFEITDTGIKIQEKGVENIKRMK
ncbi:circadian clock protein KaiC [Candidatus Pacearchaeota archaeon]|nr:circadian clock protein KaiC [Candidatus Pacearchaeota archaeon]